MPALGGAALATHALPASAYSDSPTVTITSPGAVVTTTMINVTWTYSSALSRPQARFRVRLLLNGTEVHTSGWQTSAATTYVMPFTLSGFSQYEVIVEADDLLAIGTATQEFLVNLAVDTPAADNKLVGSIYEVGIDGTGYMLIDSPDGEFRYRRQAVNLEPERTALDADSQAVDRYTMIRHSNWRSGEGQQYRNRVSSDTSKYFYSEGVNPFKMGEITCLPQTPLLVSDNYNEPQVVVAGLTLFVRTGDAELTAFTPSGTATAFNPGLAGTPTVGRTHLTSDGNYWYITDGATVRRNNFAADPAGNWSTEDVTEITWCGDRIMGLDTVASPQELISFSPAGVGTVIVTHPAPADMFGLCGGNGFVWYGVNRGLFSSEVRFWQVDSSPTKTGVGFTLPMGEQVHRLFFYLGNVFVAAYVPTVNGNSGKIYRCVPSEGLLTPQLVVEGLPALCTSLAGLDRFVAFAWPAMQRNGRSGIGVIDLETNGVARWHAAHTTPSGSSIYVTPWVRDFAFAVSMLGLYGRKTSELLTPTYVTGFLETSTSDFEAAIYKYLDSITLTTQPLKGTVVVSWSVDSNQTWNTAATFASAGATTLTTTVGSIGSTIALRVDLTPGGLGPPVVTLLVAKTHPRGLADEVLTLPVNCADRLNGLNGVELPESAPGTGIARSRTLTALLGRAIAVQDVDWPITGESNVFQVVAADITSIGTFDRLAGRRADHSVCVLTLRRSLT